VARRSKAAAGGPSLESRILDEAERLFGDRGIEAVALRQIAAAAGSSNHFAVQYHFGDKDQLVQAIFNRRISTLELRRASLLREASARGELGDIHALLDIMFRPVAELVDAQGRRTYAAFLLGLHHFGGATNPRVETVGFDPVTQYLSDLLYATAPHLPSEAVRRRLVTVFLMYLRELVGWERQQARGDDAMSLDEVITEAINMGAAAFLCPQATPGAA